MHIVLSILKIAGISVMVFIMLLIFLLILLLFVPFHYRIYGKMTEPGKGEEREIQAKLTVSFLWFLFRISWEYEKENLKRSIRLFGIPILRPKKQKRKDRQEKQETQEMPSRERETESEAEAVKKEDAEKDEGNHAESHIEKEYIETIENLEEDFSIFIRIWRFLLSFPEWVLDRLKALKRLASKAVSTKDAMLEMAGKASSLWKNEHMRNGAKKLWAELKCLLLKLKPHCRKGYVHFGFEDPCKTGRILGILGILYGFYGDTVRIEPDFERNVLEGEAELYGKIRMFLIFRSGFLLYRDKEIRYVFKAIRNMGKE